MQGWISIHRQMQEHWLWKEKREFSKAEAWIDILLNVNHQDAEVNIKNEVYKVKRGDSIISLKNWADRWNWSKGRVKRYFTLLQKENMIRFKCDSKTTHLTVCKYDSYQGLRNTDGTQTKREWTSIGHQTDTNNNDNNGKNEKKIIIKGAFSIYEIIKKDEVFLRNLFQELLGKYTFLELNNLHKDLRQRVENYYQFNQKFKIKLNDERHLKNSFKKFALSHWNKNSEQVERI